MICAPAVRRSYPYGFYLPAAVIFGVIFVVPTLLSFWFSLTRWTLFDSTFIGLDNFQEFLRDPQLTSGLRNTLVYAAVTSGLKVAIGLPLAALLTFEDPLQEPPPLDHLLPGPGQHGCGRHHVRAC